MATRQAFTCDNCHEPILDDKKVWHVNLTIEPQTFEKKRYSFHGAKSYDYCEDCMTKQEFGLSVGMKDAITLYPEQNED